MELTDQLSAISSGLDNLKEQTAKAESGNKSATTKARVQAMELIKQLKEVRISLGELNKK